MSRENVDLVLSLYRAVETQEYERPFEALAEDVVWDMSAFPLPDTARIYRGHDGVREFWVAWLASWETLEFTKLEPEEHGEHVVVEVEQRNRGRGSGVDVEFRYFQTFTVHDGKVTASRTADTRAEALELLERTG